ncbi:hypothetical protein B0H67DRAFT_494840 [Lasiosphaeris hirsuta]|uniref:Ubiquitin carboxyl-terminal hydrolase n=1 Tax=Lasiosphaeris hirsuta TaxID=260670 RepID=A0AA40DNZ6_9PEZI|nr:hypothetical protein B0H67DRAFT_494840 [Lasiosphaeris hirsuta]
MATPVGQNGFAVSSNGRPGGARGGKRPLPHIEDIVSVTVDVDAFAPIEKVLQIAETYLKQAESAKTFGRPDIALKDYIRTNIVVLDVIKKNKGWVSLQNDNKTQYERYQRLLRQVLNLSSEFDKIKADIKVDNARSGVQATAHRPTSSGERLEGRTQDGVSPGQKTVNGTVETKQNGLPLRSAPAPPPPRSRPAVHPKPQGLHGKALPAVAGTPQSTAPEDLAQRFARLRANNAAGPAQDPRIRTQQIGPPKLSADIPRPAAPLAGAVAGMPKVPAAIYNPARGTVSSEAAELPSSAPRAMFTRTNSTQPVPAASRNVKPAPISSEEYFVPTQTFGSPAGPPKRATPAIPEGDTISAQDLMQCMKAGTKDVSILLIDIRSRDLFDEGHIMSQATICLDPEVLTRKDISANEIADSMVLAPTEEQLLFEKRHNFDLVVFYDQQSLHITGQLDTPEQQAIFGLHNALIHYDFPGVVAKKIKPKLLEGGLEAWTSLVGNAGLQTSSTSPTNLKAGSNTLARSFLNRRQTYITRPIQDAAEAKKWEETIADMGAISPIRTTEDFLRRIPAPSGTQESMASPMKGWQDNPFKSRLSQDESLYSSLPAPPTRPPPTLPRRSYSGLADPDSNAAMLAKRTSVQLGAGHHRQHRTGLRNPGVFCFANSSLQAMFAAPGFSREIYSKEWAERYKNPPRKPDERAGNPQLLIRILANLFEWLNNGTVDALEAKTLMSYVHHVHSKYTDGNHKPESEIFGGPCQQDAQEFYSFVMDIIHDETNMLRDRKPSKEEKPYTPKDGTIIQNAIDHWRDYSSASASIIDKYFRGLEMFISRCNNPSCRQEIRLFQPCDVWILNLAGASDPTDLEKLLTKHQAAENFPELLCETCNRPGRTRRTRFARLPDRLAFCLNRFHGTATSKIHTKVRFPIRDLDLTRYCAEPDPDMSTTDDPHFAGRMRYDCYAVTVHSGHGINGGHYYTYVQDDQSRDPTDWWKCNDEKVNRVKIGLGPGDATEELYQNQGASAYMVYYRRQGT